jgi:hypothetical protein
MRHRTLLVALVAGIAATSFALLGQYGVSGRAAPQARSPVAGASEARGGTQGASRLAAGAAPRPLRPLTVAAREDSAEHEEPRDARGGSVDPPVEDPETSRGKVEKHKPVTMAEIIAPMDAGFSREPPDRDWTSEMDRKVEENLRTSLAGPTVKSVDCRVSICRVELLYEDEKHYRQALASVVSLSDGEMAATKGAETADGKWPMIMYMARYGASLHKLAEDRLPTAAR